MMSELGAFASGCILIFSSLRFSPYLLFTFLRVYKNFFFYVERNFCKLPRSKILYSLSSDKIVQASPHVFSFCQFFICYYSTCVGNVIKNRKKRKICREKNYLCEPKWHIRCLKFSFVSCLLTPAMRTTNIKYL